MPSSTNCSGIWTPGNKSIGSHPPLLFGAAVFATLIWLTVRGFLQAQESPYFSVETPAGIRVSLEEGDSGLGVRQYHDSMTIGDAIKLTDGISSGSGVENSALLGANLVDGMVVGVSPDTGEIASGCMPARQRLALGIPLHPDRMTIEDWEALPGIGPGLATQIELDRQKNGDFGRFDALDRVKGIGPAKLKLLEPYFSCRDN